MFTSISTALSGINAASIGIDVVGNNLANLNTSGYKSNRVSFQDVMSQSLGGSQRTSVGLGVQRPITSTQFAQGAIGVASGAFDSAISGTGFFVVKDANNQTLLTRAGDFTNDKDGNLVTVTGQAVQGWQASPNGTINTNTPPTGLTIPVGKLFPPSPTNSFSVNANLDASAVAGSAAGTFSQQIQGVDSLGNILPLNVTFTKDLVVPNQWNYSVDIPANLTTAAPTSPGVVQLGVGSVTFDSAGQLISPAPPTTAVPTAVQLTVPTLTDSATIGPAAAVVPPNAGVISWNLWNPDGSATLTQYSQKSQVSQIANDGQTAAQLTGVALADDGKIEATYSNGAHLVVGQLALASVRNTVSLVSLGNNNFGLTSQTSPLTIGTSGTGGRGVILGQSLEGSTVDITAEFANLLIFQRSYQANSRVVTASDELVQDTMQLIK